MRLGRVLSILSLGLLTGITTDLAAAPHPAPSAPGPRAAAYVHGRVREHLQRRGEVRVIAVMGDPSLPHAWARDWRERGPAIRELARRVQGDAPRFRVRRGYEVFPFLAGTVDQRGMEELAASPFVEAVYPDRQVRADLAESGPLIGQPYAEDTAGYDGTDIGIAIIDTGIDYTHPDLDAGKVVAGYNFLAGDPLFPQYTSTSQYMDDEGHGTYVSGIAAGTGPTYRGLAPGADLLALKSLDNIGLGFSSNIIAAIDWCITHKTDYNIKVINLSLGDGAEWRDPEECDADPEGQAISEAVDNGIAVVVAAGNEEYTRGIGMPACAAAAIGVGATWDAGTEVDTPAYFSNRGELIDVYAPGIWITSARLGGNYETGAGTSAATPHVAGAIAVLADAGVTGPDAIRARLKRTGLQIVDPTTHVATPRIDLERAITNQPASGPDLVVTQVTADSSSALVGAALGLNVTVKNQGDTASGPCRAVILMSANRVPSPQDFTVAVVDVPALSAGETWSSGTVAGAVPGTSPGDYWVAAFADSEYALSEKDETNNGKIGSSFTIKALSSYVSANSIPADMLKGEAYEIAVVMWNESDVPWTSAEGYALGAVSPEGTNRWGVTTIPLPTSMVAPGGTATFTFTVTAPTEPGLYPCHWRMKRGAQYFGEIATGASKTRVYDDAAWGQRFPAISGDRVAYSDYSIVPGYAAAISVSNLTTGTKTVLPDDIGFQRTWDPKYQLDLPPPPYKFFEASYHFFPDISGPWVAWIVDDYPENQWYYQIVAQNVQDLNVLPARVTYQNKDALFPSIDGSLVVWEDYRNDPDGMFGYNFIDDNADIYIADLSTLTSPDDHFPYAYPLCTAPGPQLVPRISYPYVVWEDWRDTSEIQSDIYLYDLSLDSDGDGLPNWKETSRPSPDPAETRLTNTFWPEEFPDIDGTTVVYMDLRRDTGLGGMIDIYALDVDSPTAAAVATEPPTFRYHPRIDGTKVTWADWRQGLPDIYWVDMENMAGGPIAASGSREDWPDVSGTWVAYAKHRLTLTRTDLLGNLVDYDVYNIWVQQMLYDGAVGVGTFTDVSASFWAWRHIEAAVASNVVRGYGDGTYQPLCTVTRDQMAVYIARALAGGDENVPDGPATASFSDVPNTGYGEDETEPYWAYKYVEYCAHPDQDVVKGYDDDTYRPLEPVNRGQMATYIGRALAGGDTFFDSYTPLGGPSFPDVLDTGYGDDGTEPYWAYKYIEYIADAEVTQGYPDGNYYPEVVVGRDQMAVYISRAFGYAD
ncbi:MAG TPA: S8 family serine peptidase [Armatimonadota bacterium]|nr:S8 family serine peptidase [Armatimonadota bacterium]